MVSGLDILSLLMMCCILMIFLPFIILHILALLGFGDGTPFTSERAASKRFYDGDLSIFAIAVSAAIIAAMLYAGAA